MDAFLRALQGGQFPAGTRAELEARFGALVTDELIAAGLLVRGKQATTYPCPNLGACCPRTVVPNPGDEAFPFVDIPSDATHCCDAVRLTADDLATWTTSRARLVAIVSEHFRVNGPANLRDPAFPHAHRLGRAVWQGLEREVLLCTNLNGPSAVAHLLARKAQQLPTLVVAHARTRFTSPDIDQHFATGHVVVVFLESELELVAGQVARREVLMVRDSVTPYKAAPFCVVIDASGRRTLDKADYDAFVARAEDDLDLFLDLTTTVAAGRHPTGRREGAVFIRGSVTPQQGGAYAELMERQQAVRAAAVRAIQNVNHPAKLIEGARRELDVKISRYEWRSTELLRGDSPEAKRYWFRPPKDLRWALLQPLDAAS